jgi:hypothetical protein
MGGKNFMAVLTQKPSHGVTDFSLVVDQQYPLAIRSLRHRLDPIGFRHRDSTSAVFGDDSIRFLAPEID